MNSAFGGTSTAAAGADALAFGGLDAAAGDAGDGIDLKLLAPVESRSLNYCSNILSVVTETPFVSARFASMAIVKVPAGLRPDVFLNSRRFFGPIPIFMPDAVFALFLFSRSSFLWREHGGRRGRPRLRRGLCGDV